ncbi:MAG TPA: hypothetical protein EYQ66_07905 [Myxococcales bacterium]|nr:hypothetical protein [Myxococcales bacterium]
MAAVALVSGPAQAEPAAPMAPLLGYFGLTPKDLQKLGDAPVVVEVEVSDRKRQAAFAGLIRIQDADGNFFLGSGPLDAAPLDSALSLPPTFLAPEQYGRFSNPARVGDLAALTLADDDYAVLAECKPADCRFKLDASGIREAGALDWKAEGARERFLDWFRPSLVAEVSHYRKAGLSGLITYADKPAPYPVAQGIVQLGQEARPVLDLYPALAQALDAIPGTGSEPRAASLDTVIWSVSDFGYRPTLSVDRMILYEGSGAVMALMNLYSNHYLAGRLQLGGIILDGQLPGVSGDFFWVLDQLLFDDSLSGFKRSLLGRGLKSDLSDRLKRIRKNGETPLAPQ